MIMNNYKPIQIYELGKDELKLGFLSAVEFSIANTTGAPEVIRWHNQLYKI